MADLPRLVQKCPDCGGHGAGTNPEFERWVDREGLSEEEAQEAFVEAPPRAPTPELTCGVCGGRGAIPTPAGQRILELVQRFGGEDDG